jgi:N-methylhydantoinase A/oxoprolinase/acetone carboxylase beta subunit
VGLVSLSTTLATNAIVEGRGGRAGLLLIGLGEAALARGGLKEALGDTPVGLVAGGHAADGAELAPLDLMGAEALVARLLPQVEAFAVCGEFAVRNPAHERAVAAIATAAGRPVTCSHELTARLDAPRRALTTLLNARLIPEIAALLDAVEAMLRREAIGAPVMVVAGDGSLLAAGTARQRPVETVLSGPAASIVGAAFLAGLDDALVADVGGTTTDVALLRSGRPRLSPEGAVVGGHATMVEAIEVHTSGLGGDSELRRGEDGGPALGPRRVVPLSLLASEWPEALALLERQAARPQPREHDGRFVLRRRAPAGPAGAGAARLWGLLADGPVLLEDVVDRHHLGLALRRLGGQGQVIEAGFTPSDAAHLLGSQSGWSVEAARLGALIQARLLFPGEAVGAEELARRVLRLAQRCSGELLVEAALAADGEPAAGLAAEPRRLLSRALAEPASTVLRLRLELGCPVVAVGGPANLFYPLPAQQLHTRLVVPPHHATCNAVGAVVGRVERRATVLVAATAEGGWRVHTAVGPRDVTELEQALAMAEDSARDAVLDAARAAGAAQAELRIDRKERSFVDPTGARRLLDIEIVAVAIGRPRVGR